MELLAVFMLPFLAWGAYSFVEARIAGNTPDLRAAGVTDAVTLVRVSIAFDAGARDRLQGLLGRRVSRSLRPHQLVGAVAGALVGEIEHARMFAVGVSRVFGWESAQKVFQHEIDQQRARTDATHVATTQSASRSGLFRAGGGYVVVTLLVGRATELHLRSGAGATLADLCAMLKLLCSATPEETLFAESVWAPTDADELMSLGEMTQRFPELVPVADGISGGDFCVVLCPFCKCVYSAHASACPACHRPSSVTLVPLPPTKAAVNT